MGRGGEKSLLDSLDGKVVRKAEAAAAAGPAEPIVLGWREETAGAAEPGALTGKQAKCRRIGRRLKRD